MKPINLFGALLLSGICTWGTACRAAGQPASDETAGPASEARIRTLEDQVHTLSSQIAALRSASGKGASSQPENAKVGISNGRPTITSPDGKFSAALRTLVQFDWAYYSQSEAAAALPPAYGPDFSSGANFRRVYLGLQGKLFGDWSYNFNVDFGGSGGTETSGHIQSAYLQYDGLAPWAFRIGAFPPPANIEDGTGSGDTIFLERNSPSNLQRALAGGDGRDAVSILYGGERLFGAFSYTGGKVQDSAVFDEQQALLGRAAYLLLAESDRDFLIGANGTYVIKLPDAVPNGSASLSSVPGAAALHSIKLSDPPELTVDSNGIRLANTGSLPTDHLTQWGVEAAGNWASIYAQAGYYQFEIERAAVAYTTFSGPAESETTVIQPSNNAFSAWYVQTAWTITGEARAYNTANGAFSSPKPTTSIGHGGWGAWELAARYSVLNLNSHVLDDSALITGWNSAGARTYTFYNTVRGGHQRIVTVGLNWYASTAIRFALDYQWIDVDRLQAPSTVTSPSGAPVLPAINGGQRLQTFAFRAQFAL